MLASPPLPTLFTNIFFKIDLSVLVYYIQSQVPKPQPPVLENASSLVQNPPQDKNQTRRARWEQIRTSIHPRVRPTSASDENRRRPEAIAIDRRKEVDLRSGCGADKKWGEGRFS